MGPTVSRPATISINMYDCDSYLLTHDMHGTNSALWPFVWLDGWLIRLVMQMSMVFGAGGASGWRTACSRTQQRSTKCSTRRAVSYLADSVCEYVPTRASRSTRRIRPTPAAVWNCSSLQLLKPDNHKRSCQTFSRSQHAHHGAGGKSDSDPGG